MLETEPFVKPAIRLVGLKMTDVTLFEQRFLLTFRVENPNPYPLPIKGLSFELTLQESPFATGGSHQGLLVPARGEGLVDVSISTSLFRAVAELRALLAAGAAGEGTLSYRMSGQIHPDLPLIGPVSFEESGVLDLGGGRQGSPARSTPMAEESAPVADE